MTAHALFSWLWGALWGDRRRPAIATALGGASMGCAPHTGPHPHYVPPGESWGCRWQQRLWDEKVQFGLVSSAPGEAVGAQMMA